MPHHRNFRRIKSAPSKTYTKFLILAVGFVMMSPIIQASAATVEVVVSGIRPGGTAVYAALCTGTLTIESCTFRSRQTATASSLRFDFANVPPGRYAALAFQDLNGNGTLDRTRLGFPKEPFALSRNAGRRHAPTFEQAAAPIGPNGAQFHLELRGIVLRGQ